MTRIEEKRDFPLAGVRILAVEQFITGPYCTQLLADAGAEVIKVERPGTGDPRRTMGPYLEGPDGQQIAGGFIEYNRSKKSIALDMASSRGRKIFRSLAKRSDVVVENLRPGSMKRLGLDYDALSSDNPGLIYAAISGFGRLEDYAGPYKNWPAFDIVTEAMSGIMDIVGFEDRPPTYTIYGMADVYSGIINALSIMMALYQRETTGLGQMVDTSMYDSMVSLNERAIALYSMTGEGPTRGRERVLGPRGAYAVRDGYVAINIPTDDMWARLARAMDREDLIEDPRCLTGPDRAQNQEYIRTVLEQWLAPMTREDAVRRLQSASVPAGPVQTVRDVSECPQIEARRMLLEVPHPEAGTLTMARSPMRLSRSPEVEAGPPPKLGEHTREILSNVLGLSDEEISGLTEEAVVGHP